MAIFGWFCVLLIAIVFFVAVIYYVYKEVYTENMFGLFTPTIYIVAFAVLFTIESMFYIILTEHSPFIIEFSIALK